MSRLLPFALSAVLVAGALWAQEPPPAAEETTELEEVVVTASRGARAADTVPANVTVITREDIAKSNAQNVPDLLKEQAGVNVQNWLGNAAIASVDVGGFGETGNLNTVVLVDGMRVDFADISAVDWTVVPLHQIERIELVRGGGATLYGANAAGGVINIITRAGGKNQATGGVEVDSFGYRQKLGLSGTVKDLGYSLRQGYTDGDGYRANNNYRSENYHLGLSFQPAESFFGLEFRAGTNDEDYGLPGSLTRAQLDAGYDWNDSDEPLNHAKRETHYVSATPKLFLNDENTLQLGLSYRERYSDAYYNFGGFPYLVDARDTALGLAPQWTNTSELLGRASTFTLGLEHYESDKHNIRNTVEASRRTTDVFLTETLELVDNVLLDLGYRHGRAEFEFADFADRGFDLDAYRAGLTWNYRQGSKLFASWDRSFRVGSLDEYIVYPDWPAAPFVNPNLLPQLTETLQAGLKHRFGPRLTAGVTVFQIETKDEIFYDPNDGTFSAFPGANRNYDHTLRQGVTTELTSQVTDDWRVFANHTYTLSEMGDDNGAENYHGRHIPMVPEHTVNVGSDLTFLEAFTWTTVARWRDHQYSASDWRNNLDMVSDYVVVDTKLSYTWEWLNLYAGVSNVFDEEYAEFVTRGVNYYPSPGRTFLAGVNVTYEF